MKKISVWTFIVLLGAGGDAFSQNEADILRYSYRPLAGDARSMALAGSMGTTGANIGAASTNPAGLGFFRSTHYSVSLGYTGYNINSNYINNKTNTHYSNINIPNIGIVFTNMETDKGKEKKKGLISYSFHLGLNRLNNFNRNIKLSGVNNSSSINDYFAQNASGIPEGDFSYDSPEGQAYYAYLINPVPNSDQYEANLPIKVSTQQDIEITERGRNNSMDFGMGFNVSNKIYFGGGLAFSTLSYENQTIVNEQTLDLAEPQRRLTHETTFAVSGTGVVGKLGLIVRVNDYLRVGGAFHSRSRHIINDNYFWTTNSTNYAKPDSFISVRSRAGLAEYNITTPARYQGGFTLLWPKKGLLAFELEHVNYGRGKISSTLYNYEFENSSASNVYNSATNIKIGAEYLYRNFRFRAGYALMGSPFKKDFSLGFKDNTRNFSLGTGYQTRGGFFVDLAFINSWQRTYYTPYVINNPEREYYTGTNDVRMWNIMLSIGSRL